MMKSWILFGGVGVLVLLAAGGCARGGAAAWKPGDEYDVLLRVVERPSQLPSVPAPAADSVHVKLMVDSVRSDSAFGRYSGRFASVGVPVGDMGQSPELFAAVVRDSATVITLAPNVVDAELVLFALGRGTHLSGTWRKQSPLAYRGTFQLRKAAGG